ncbi:amidase [Kaistia sp. 32K]|uniref:amidase n=1 Tax=Kaistia sp. 32K TaxID=2795690 RepID=UPI001915E512|nr:amidase [Kaistia sp. 32K]BCP53990.1 amidase [Kaistia sp. 32K]
MSAALSDEQLAFLPLGELAARISDGEVTSVRVTELMLSRIAAHNPQLNCYITVCTEAALAQARAMDALRAEGIRLGPLHGVPIAIKDNMETAGVRTTGGSPLYADHVPERDSTVVERLRRAGAVILGKLNMYELAFGGVHPDFGETRNPWNLERSCGASSSGSGSAVAAGLAYAALGSDTGGSIRLPAAACGIVGLKATYGVVSRAGVLPAGYSLDHVGPMTRTVTDAAILMQVLAGPDPRDPAGSERPASDYLSGIELGIDGLRIGVPRRQANERIGQEMLAAFHASLNLLRRAGARLVEIELPDHLASRSLMWAIAASELAEGHSDSLRERPNDYSPRVRGLITQGAFLPATEYIHAQRVRQTIARSYAEIMQSVDLIAMPVVPFPAWRVGDEDVTYDNVTENLMSGMTRYCPPFNITGQPAIALPAGFDSVGLPLSFQIAGRLHEDALVLRAARAFERLAGPHPNPVLPPVAA